MHRTAPPIFRTLALAALFGATVDGAFAAPLSAGDAVRMAQRWRARSGLPSVRPAAAPTGRARTFSDDGTDLFHLVELDGGGFVAVAADDTAPVPLAFSPTGEMPEADDGGPLWTMLAADGAAAAGSRPAKGMRRGARPGPSARRRLDMRETTHAASGAGSGTRNARLSALPGTSGISAVSDVRVAPLVESRWSQREVGAKYAYNYYTPNHWYCGCVATAMAQLMRYHRFPSAAVAPQTFPCYTNEVECPLSMAGGVYDWDAMPLRPNSATITDAQLEAIGRLCFDAGVSVRMHYALNGSGAFLGFAFEPLRSVFGFADAHAFFLSDGTPSAEVVENAILANLDAGCPVLLGISDANSGHAIVADGYGYDDGTLWCHLNMGWSGSSDLWYALPKVMTPGYAFSAVDDIVYNVFPETAGTLVTGRVCDEDGNPLENATVTAVATYTAVTGSWFNRKRTTVTNAVVSATTAASGVYAVLLPTNRTCSVSLAASYGAGVSQAVVTQSAASVSPTSVDFSTGEYLYDSPLSIGNSWGNDLVVATAAAGTPSVLGFAAAASDGTDGFSLSFAGTPGAKYHVEYAPTLTNETWSVVTNLLLAPEGSATLFLPVGDDGSGFWRVTPTPAPSEQPLTTESNP